MFPSASEQSEMSVGYNRVCLFDQPEPGATSGLVLVLVNTWFNMQTF